MLDGPMLELLEALHRYAQTTGSPATSAAHLLGVVRIAFTDACAMLTEQTYWIGHPDEILDNLPPGTLPPE
jgi:hypothetical protein